MVFVDFGGKRKKMGTVAPHVLPYSYMPVEKTTRNGSIHKYPCLFFCAISDSFSHIYAQEQNQ